MIKKDLIESYLNLITFLQVCMTSLINYYAKRKFSKLPIMKAISIIYARRKRITFQLFFINHFTIVI